ncbi:MAG: hypothetical protein HN742_40270 [Lentisphaerae bacterium]|jgi:hypothetical protein|nr:hypothetical protein [Lentisphaerota bacterium]MBT7848172.1 hypothetical protein [Lentisphaerota bacterium]
MITHDTVAHVITNITDAALGLHRQLEHAGHLLEHVGQQEFSDAEHRADCEKTREQARAMIHAIESGLKDGRSRDALAFCRQLREVLGLVEQPDLPPADTAGGE